MRRSLLELPLVALLLALATSCTSTRNIPLADAERARMAEAAALHVVLRAPASLTVRTPADAALGGLGVVGLVAASQEFEQEGESMRRRYQLPDPARSAAERFAAALRHKFGAPEASPAQDADAEAEASAVAALFADGLVLDLRTEYWDLSYFGSGSMSRYRLDYRGSARLLEAPSGRVLWQARCVIEPPAARRAIELEKLVADDAALLKQKLAALGQACADKLWVRLQR